MIFDHLGPAMRYLRKRRGLIQKTIAKAGNLSHNLISNWETGATFPSWDSLTTTLGILQADLLDLHNAMEVVSKEPDSSAVLSEPGRQRETSLSAIGPALHLLRQRFGVTQKEVAETAGISKNLVSNWETGNTKPSLSSLDKILHEVLGVDLFELHNTFRLLSGKPAVRLETGWQAPAVPVAEPTPGDELGWFLEQMPLVLRWVGHLQTLLLDPQELERLSRRLSDRRGR